MNVDFKRNLSSEQIIEIIKNRLTNQIPILLSLKLKPVINDPQKWEKGCCHIVLVTDLDHEYFYFNETGNGIKNKLPVDIVMQNLSDDRDILIIQKR